jgi:hypothetical protein
MSASTNTSAQYQNPKIKKHVTGLSYRLAQKAVKKELKLFPYKVSAVQQLKDADYQKRLYYCVWFTHFIPQN